MSKSDLDTDDTTNISENIESFSNSKKLLDSKFE